MPRSLLCGASAAGKATWPQAGRPPRYRLPPPVSWPRTSRRTLAAAPRPVRPKHGQSPLAPRSRREGPLSRPARPRGDSSDTLRRPAAPRVKTAIPGAYRGGNQGHARPPGCMRLSQAPGYQGCTRWGRGCADRRPKAKPKQERERRQPTTLAASRCGAQIRLSPSQAWPSQIGNAPQNGRRDDDAAQNGGQHDPGE